MAAYEIARVSAAMAARIRELDAEAKAAGIEKDYRAAIRRVYRRLASDPTEFGEPTFTFAHLGLRNYVAVLPPIVVEYCVDEARKLVYLRTVKLLGPIKA